VPFIIAFLMFSEGIFTSFACQWRAATWDYVWVAAGTGRNGYFFDYFSERLAFFGVVFAFLCFICDHLECPDMKTSAIHECN